MHNRSRRYSPAAVLELLIFGGVSLEVVALASEDEGTSVRGGNGDIPHPAEVAPAGRARWREADPTLLREHSSLGVFPVTFLSTIVRIKT